MLKLNKKNLSRLFITFLVFSFFIPLASFAQLCNTDGQLIPNLPEEQCRNRNGTMVEVCKSTIGVTLPYPNKTACEGVGGGTWIPKPPATIPSTSLLKGINKSSSIGEYVRAIYTYGISVVGILATIVIMIGGLIWITSMGNAARVSNAKDWIGAALTGLALAMFSYTLLWIVNPDLVNFKGINPEKASGKSVISDREITAAVTYGSLPSCEENCKQANSVCKEDVIPGKFFCLQQVSNPTPADNGIDCSQEYEENSWEWSLCREQTPNQTGCCQTLECYNTTTGDCPEGGTYIQGQSCRSTQIPYICQ